MCAEDKTARAINDATLTKIGDIYQYLIALKDCFDLKNGETLQIEVNGDVSVITKNGGKYQKEVKHHLSEKAVSERDIDFWKTLANWYCDYDRIVIFDQLILFTTSTVKRSSRYYDWNHLKKEEKLLRIKAVGDGIKTKEKGFRTQYGRIFDENYDENKLLNILDKFIIEYNCNTISGISEEFDSKIGFIPKENRDDFIFALMGRIMQGIKEPPHRMNIKKDDFDQILQIETKSYGASGLKTLPGYFEDESIPLEDSEKLKNKRFVTAIKDIDYDEKIQSAIYDYWRMIMTVNQFLQNDIFYLKSIPHYKKDLESVLNYMKDNSQIDAQGLDGKDRNKIAKRLYNDAMILEAKDFGSIVQNRPFFQHGIIHDIVEDGHFVWRIEEDEH